MITRLIRHTVLLLFVCLTTNLAANNVQISNVTRTGNLLSFSVSWDNSWRVSSTAPYNYDAVWLFVKYRDCATLQWGHVNIDSAYSATPLFADTTSDQKGVMLYRAADGVGNVNGVSVTVRMAGLPSGNFDFTVFGIEMVYVPTGAYSLGDGAASGAWRTGTNVALPFQVNNEDGITVANSGISLYAGSNVAGGTIPPGFPKGYAGFYLMKYEISQEQYADFLNTLTSVQAAARYMVGTGTRYTLTGAWPVIATTAGNRAMNFMNWDDLAAYLDWAALRPFTELEFEKACRGTAAYVPNEYAWGTTLIVDANTPVNDGTPTESVSDVIPAGAGIANYNNNVVVGPLRNGFRGTAATNRLQIGATYYGICEMSGNLWERVIQAGDVTGRPFVRSHGDGSLTATGLANVGTWPAAAGTGIRGGSYYSGVATLEVSDRSSAIFSNNVRYGYTGGRGARD